MLSTDHTTGGHSISQLLILEFDGAVAGQYDAVNGKLGIDPTTRNSDWPAGLLTHTAGTTDTGAFAVVEVWESQQSQDAFMNGRLGPALAAVGVPQPIRATWIDLRTHMNIVP